MSNRDSLGRGDLIPQDVVNILAQEKHNRRSRKKRSNSIGRALGWLKGKKRRDLAKGEKLGRSPEIFMSADAKPAGHHGGHHGGNKGGQRSGRQVPTQGHAALKLEDEKSPTPPLLQENVFIESSRPKYLENLHSEALEGLKMMQQEESNNGVDCKDNESTISTMTVHTDGEGGGFMTDSTIGDTTSVVSVQSSVSTRSSRSGLTRQESTFRPLNSGKKPEKGRTKRRQRKTIGGIPQHVQMELGLDRGGWAVGPRLEEEEVHNGETDDSSAPDGPRMTTESQKDADGCSRQGKAILPLNKNQIEQLTAAHAGPRDDIAMLHNLVPDSSGKQRPQSLAVPWMTTANSVLQKPPSPVMSMSPQAAYMSKIIPNAVLPPSIDVVEISRGRSRNSVRTVSHGSLLLSSPATSRPSSRACSSRASSKYSQNLSDSSCWSNSGSTETLVSDSSTVSSSTTPRQQGSQDGDRNAVLSSGSRASHISNGLIPINRDEIKKEGPFARSLSVMKPKKAPPPPSRSYSLHSKMKRRSRDLAGVISGESPHHVIPVEENKTENKSSPPPSRTIDSPGYNADTSSLEDSTGSTSFSPMRSQLQVLKPEQAAKAEVTGPKDASRGKQESVLKKVVSPSSGYSSQDGSSKPKNSPSTRHRSGILAKLQRLFPGSTSAVSITPPLTLPEVSESTKSEISVDACSVSPSVRALIELFNIPPPPKVHAPPPPPPEVWAHSKRTFELLLGPPAPDNISDIIKKNPKDRRWRSSSLTESAVKSLTVERKHKSPASEPVSGAQQMLETKKGQESMIMNVVPKEHDDRWTSQNVDLMGNVNVSELDGKVRVSNMLNGILVKAVEKQEERLAAGRQQEGQQETMQATEIKTKTDKLPAISLVHISPPVPLLQPLKQTTESVMTEPLSPELSWPPPPPPVGANGPDDFELPLPPPPVFVEGVLAVPAEAAAHVSHQGSGASKMECDRVKEEAEGSSPPSLNIPPPPPYTAPPPPVTAVYPPLIKNVSNPHLKDVSPSLPINVSPSPPTVKYVIPPPPNAVTPPPPFRAVTPLPTLKEVSPPPTPPKVATPPPPKGVSPPPPTKDVSPPPPPKDVSPPPPKVATPPPPPKAATPLPPTEVSPPSTPKDVSPPPPPKVATPPPPPKAATPPPPPKAATPPPPPKAATPPPPPKAATPLPPTEVSPPSTPKDVSPPPPPKAATPPPPIEVPLPPPTTEDSSPIPLTTVPSPLLVEVSSLPPQQMEDSISFPAVEVSLAPPPPTTSTLASMPSYTEVVLPPIQEKVLKEDSPEPMAPPCIPHTEPSWLHLSGTDIVLPQGGATSSCEANQESLKRILTPPQSIPPPPPIELPHQPEDATTDGPTVPKFSISAPSENSFRPSPETPPPKEKTSSAPANIVIPPPITVQDLSNVKHESSPASTEGQASQGTPATVIKDESTPFVPPSLQQTAEPPSVNRSSEAPQVQEEPGAEVRMRKNIPASSSTAEAPQKPIRKSLIINLPSPASPPAVAASQPPAPKSEPLVVPPVSSTSVSSLTIKSPPAASVSPSMNLQEAIRLRTAARSLGVPSSRLSLHSPTSPSDLRKSPSSTASFIFAKSSKVVIEAKPVAETKAATHKNQDVSSPPKAGGETEAAQKGTKVPPPVAKKPKTKGKEIDTSEEIEPTAGQEEQQECSMDDAEKRNGTAGTVELTPSP